jgi:mannosyltransferase OCH1-like enzyme
MYVDFDYESIEPLDEPVKDKTCCFAMEPESHCRIFGKSLMFNNALMLSIPGHPFMQKVIETVFSESRQKSVTDAAATQPDEKRRKNHIVLYSTGPWMLMDLYDQLSKKEKSDLYLIPDQYVTPFDVNQAHSVTEGADTEELNQCLKEAYAVHYFFGFWKNDQK